MNGIYAAFFRESDDAGNVQIRSYRTFVDANFIRLICMRAELAVHILTRIHCHRTQAKIVASTENTDRDFTAICRKHLLERFLCHKITSSL